MPSTWVSRASALAFVVLLGPTPAPTAATERCLTGPFVSAGIDNDSLLSGTHSADTVTIASLNMAGQMGIADALAAWMNTRAIDVLFLQEVGQANGDGAAFMAALHDRLRLPYVYAPATPFENGHAQGLAIVSRYRLNGLSIQPLAYNHLRFRSRCRIALTATVSTPEGSIRLTNVHLDTRINASRRVGQLTPALEALDALEGPQIIGGDFNTAKIGWMDSMWPVPFAQDQVNAVREELSKAGFDTPFGETRPTFKFLGLPLKLDWLYFRKLETRESGVDDVPLSDHRGIWTRARLPVRRTRSASSGSDRKPGRPYLNNGSVANMWDLLTAPKARPAKFSLGSREYDTERLGYVSTPYPKSPAAAWEFDATQPSNSNAGHVYGTRLGDDDKWALIEFMKILRPGDIKRDPTNRKRS